RAGRAAPRGLKLATGRPAICVSTFDAAAHATALDERRGRNVLAAVDSRREEIFIQAFDQDLAALGPPMVLRPDDAAAQAPAGASLVAGDAAALLLAALQKAKRDALAARAAGATDAAVVAAIAAQRLLGAGALPPLRPLYLRQPDVTPQPRRNK
ncbi:MAG: tRNA (adenosine(37)-N6)-threonylcarbamoyltransferase complex dimerization subunit type 1 TsaB, partial [Rhodospirillales bacterium]